jgi:hypothetical protein
VVAVAVETEWMEVGTGVTTGPRFASGLRHIGSTPLPARTGALEGEPGHVGSVGGVGAALPLGLRQLASGIDLLEEGLAEGATGRFGVLPAIDLGVQRQGCDSGSEGPLLRG